LHIRSVLDVGCGDGYWMPDLPGYIGIDVSKVSIDLSRLRHPSRSYIRCNLLDTTMRADLIILRDVVQHLSLEEGTALVHAAHERCQWLLASTYVGGENTGLNREQQERGYGYPNDLTVDPFHLGQPVNTYFDGAGWQDPAEVRDKRKVLGLWTGVPYPTR